MGLSDLLFERMETVVVDSKPPRTVALPDAPAIPAPADADEAFRALSARVLQEHTPYAAFCRATEALTDVVTDAPMRFRAGLRTCGSPPDLVLKAIGAHQGWLAKEREEFTRASVTQKDAVKADEARVEQLEQQLEELQGQRDAAVADVARRSERIRQAQAAFDAAYIKLDAQLNADRDRIAKEVK